VILMDVMMPGLTGWAALRQLKADHRTRGIPVVMMTGHIIDTSDPAGDHASVAALLMKPCTPAVLLETVDRVLGDGSDAWPGLFASRRVPLQLGPCAGAAAPEEHRLIPWS
jgi:CheY-like chemotaxis protein